MDGYCIGMTTVSNHEQAEKISKVIIEKKLAACIQEIEIKSHYIWQGELCQDSEILMFFKTRKTLCEDLQKELLNIHPYDVPEILFVDVRNGYKAYLEWIDKQTNRS